MAVYKPTRGVIVVILAGGQGERLSILSAHRAKPAVPFAGKYRIIDFALTNCVDSGLYDILVLTQYRPVSLHDHIGTGRPWDLDRTHSVGVRMISPYLGRRGAGWYRGTADAVFQNIEELEELGSEHVVILGGDHIYRMNYSEMVQQHIRRNADCTIALQKVPLEDAHRFGIATQDRGGRITDWHEKPKKPESTLASLGFYVFRTDVLIARLREDAEREGSKRDFGGDVVPRMIASGDRVYGHRFDGYWRDVGTIQSYWDCNMELLDDPPAIDLADRSMLVLTKSEERPPGQIGVDAKVTRSLVSHGCKIHGEVHNSVLSPGVVVGPGAVVRDSIVMFDSIIESGATLDRVIVDKEVIIGQDAKIGVGDDLTIPNEQEPGRLNTGITLVGKRAIIPPGAMVGRNCRIDPDVLPEHFPRRKSVPSGGTVTVTEGAPPSGRPRRSAA
ncbi:MAG: sugar phosphate nucleotidyltransferase [Thermoleophilia bacterium]